MSANAQECKLYRQRHPDKIKAARLRAYRRTEQYRRGIIRKAAPDLLAVLKVIGELAQQAIAKAEEQRQ